MEQDHGEQVLDVYLQQEYGYLGPAELAGLLTRNPAEKRYLQGMAEQRKLTGCIFRYSQVMGALGPPFLPQALQPGSVLSQPEAKRPFEGRYSSHEAGIRAQLLPDNLYFSNDAAVVRQVLGLPCTGVAEVAVEVIPKEYWWWREVAPLNVGLLSDLWEEIHVAKVKGTPYKGPELPPFVPEFLRDYLNASDPVPDARGAPVWLNRQPEFPWGPPVGYDETLPLHHFAGVLLYRYGLPPRLFGRVRRYFFSNSLEDLALPENHPLQSSGLTPMWTSRGSQGG